MGDQVMQHAERFRGQGHRLRPMPETGLVGIEPERAKAPLGVGHPRLPLCGQETITGTRRDHTARPRSAARQPRGPAPEDTTGGRAREHPNARADGPCRVCPALCGRRLAAAGARPPGWHLVGSTMASAALGSYDAHDERVWRAVTTAARGTRAVARHARGHRARRAAGHETAHRLPGATAPAHLQKSYTNLPSSL